MDYNFTIRFGRERFPEYPRVLTLASKFGMYLLPKREKLIT